MMAEITSNWLRQSQRELKGQLSTEKSKNKDAVNVAKSKAKVLARTELNKKNEQLKKNKQKLQQKNKSQRQLEKNQKKYDAAQNEDKLQRELIDNAKNNVENKLSGIRLYSKSIVLCETMTLCWNDSGSGAKLNGIFYRPVRYSFSSTNKSLKKKNSKNTRSKKKNIFSNINTLLQQATSLITPDKNYIPLGDYGQSGHGDPSGQVLMLHRDGPIAWKHPVNYTRIWKDSGSGANSNGSFWKPIPPKGYVAVGMMCQRGHSKKPALNAIACVHKSFAEKVTPRSLIWNDKKSGSNKNVSIYLNEKIGTIYVQNNYATPKEHCFWTLNDNAFYPPDTINSMLTKKSLAASTRTLKTKRKVVGNVAASKIETSATTIKNKSLIKRMNLLIKKLK